jgi:dolichol-phosphate mannosyltransferase
MSANSFAVVVPMFNEESGALRCIQEIIGVLRNFPQRTQLIIIDDASSDATGRILREAKEKFEELTIITHDRNLGYGAASQTGGHAALQQGHEYVVFMDSDLTNNPGFISCLIDRLENGYDIVKASRYIAGGGVKGVPVWRYWLSRIGNLVAWQLYRLPIRDCTNGFRAVRTNVLNRMDLRERGFAVIMEELYWAKFLGARVSEVPYVLTSRAQILRSSSFQYRPQVLYRYVKYPLLAFLGVAPSKTRQNSCEKN